MRATGTNSPLEADRAEVSHNLTITFAAVILALIAASITYRVVKWACGLKRIRR